MGPVEGGAPTRKGSVRGVTETDSMGREIAPEFKQGVIDEALRGERSIEEIAGAMSIELATLKRWLAAHVAGNMPPGAGQTSAPDESDEDVEGAARVDMAARKKRSRKNYTEAEKDGLIAQVEALRKKDPDMSLQAACDEVGVGYSIMNRWRVMRGLAQARPLKPEKRAKAIALLQKGKKVAAVAKAVGITKNTVRMWAAAAGIADAFERQPRTGDRQIAPTSQPAQLGLGIEAEEVDDDDDDDEPAQTRTLLSRPTPPRSLPPASGPRSYAAASQQFAPPRPPTADEFAREAMQEALEDRQTLRRMTDLLQRENDQLRRENKELRAGRQSNG